MNAPLKTIFHQAKIEALLRQMHKDIWMEQSDLKGNNKRELQAYLQHMAKYDMLETNERIVCGRKMPTRFKLTEETHVRAWKELKR